MTLYGPRPSTTLYPYTNVYPDRDRGNELRAVFSRLGGVLRFFRLSQGS